MYKHMTVVAWMAVMFLAALARGQDGTRPFKSGTNAL